MTDDAVADGAGSSSDATRAEGRATEKGPQAVASDPDGIFYHEEQPYRLPGLRVVLPVVLLLVAGFLVHDLWVRITAPGPVDVAGMLRGVVVPFLLMAAVAAFVAWVLGRGRMMTTVRDDGVHIRFEPFHRQGIVYPYEEIEHAAARRFHPLVEYGGWGIRWGWRGKAYLASGDEGVELSLRPRGSVMVGSQDAENLAAAIERRLRAREARRRGRSTGTPGATPPGPSGP